MSFFPILSFCLPLEEQYKNSQMFLLPYLPSAIIDAHAVDHKSHLNLSFTSCFVIMSYHSMENKLSTSHSSVQCSAWKLSFFQSSDFSNFINVNFKIKISYWLESWESWLNLLQI